MQYAKGQRCQEQQNSTFDETLQCEQNKYKSGKLLCFTTKRNYSQLLLNTQTCLILQSRLKESASPGCSFTPVTINPISHETSPPGLFYFSLLSSKADFFFSKTNSIYFLVKYRVEILFRLFQLINIYITKPSFQAQSQQVSSLYHNFK